MIVSAALRPAEGSASECHLRRRRRVVLVEGMLPVRTRWRANKGDAKASSDRDAVGKSLSLWTEVAALFPGTDRAARP
jgi:hypothetical protein